LLSHLLLCIQIYGAIQTIKDAPEEAKQLQGKIQELQEILASVKSTIGGTTPRSIESLAAEIHKCLGTAKILLDNSTRKRDKIRSLIGCLKWPVKQQETQKLITAIERLKGNLSIELQLYQA
jgi:hypothetical protein